MHFMSLYRSILQLAGNMTRPIINILAYFLVSTFLVCELQNILNIYSMDLGGQMDILHPKLHHCNGCQNDRQTQWERP